jgi:hypothetical protein
MNIENNIQTVKTLFAAIGRGDRVALLELAAGRNLPWPRGAGGSACDGIQDDRNVHGTP